jgi:hypothetical protein
VTSCVLGGLTTRAQTSTDEVRRTRPLEPVDERAVGRDDPHRSPVLRHELARGIEQVEVDLIGAANSAVRRRGAPGFLISVAGGVASCANHGSPYSKVTGLGFDGVPASDELDRVELCPPR